jgi:predicted Zn-dependent protease
MLLTTTRPQPARLCLSLMLLLSLMLALPACTVNPATGKQSLTLNMSEDQQIALGEEAAPKFVQDYGGDIPSPAVSAAVTAMGKRLVGVCERPELPWEFHVVDSAVINAFALPGGKIFITRGLLSKLTNEAQLAGVLGHEIGHVCALHITQAMARQTVLNTTLQTVGAVADSSDNQWLQVLGVGGQLGGGVYLLKFGRDQESQADELGVRYMSRLGYDPMGQVQVMQILQKEAGGGSTPEFLSTHPLPATRIERLQKLIKQKYPDRSGYKLDEQSFTRDILTPLSKLPPPVQKEAPAQQ